MPIIPVGFVSAADVLHRADFKWHSDAIDKLRGLLASGVIKAACINKIGGQTSLDPSYWYGEASHGVFLRAKLGRDEPEGIDRVVFDETDVIAAMPFPDEQNQSAPVSTAAKGGAPARFDWDAMWIEAIRVILYEKLPDKPADLRKHLQQWFMNQVSDAPGDTIMKAKIKALYDMMKREDPKS